MLRIKMCGMTRRQDVLEAVRLGVDAVGVVLYEPSPRHVTAEMARELLRDLPDPVKRVGVFVRAQATEIARAARLADLTAVQLYEGPSWQEMERAGVETPVIRVVHAGDGLGRRILPYVRGAVLVEAPPQKLPGGSGKAWDWSLLDNVQRPRYLMLAGGLHAGNVQEAVKRVKPDAVDVSTGVEVSPGVKDPARMAAFVQACAAFRLDSQESR